MGSRMSSARFAPLLVGLVGLSACGAPSARPGAPLGGARPPYSAADLAAIVDIDALAIAPDASELAVVTDRSGAYELWTATLDASGRAGPLVQRTRAGESVSGLAYAPDGASLVFEMDRGGDERRDLWIARRGPTRRSPRSRRASRRTGARSPT
jgi:dipeptidyl aminopeptidase/acylaminoacyl peptidase